MNIRESEFISILRLFIEVRGGAVSLTLTCLHLGQPKPLTGMMFREADFV